METAALVIRGLIGAFCVRAAVYGVSNVTRSGFLRGHGTICVAASAMKSASKVANDLMEYCGSSFRCSRGNAEA